MIAAVHRAGIDRECHRIDIDEHRDSADRVHREGRGYKRYGRHNHFVTGLDACSQQCNLQRTGTGVRRGGDPASPGLLNSFLEMADRFALKILPRVNRLT